MGRASRPLSRFSPGEEIEVICQDDGFKGSFYEARVVRYLARGARYLIVYETLMDESDKSMNLRESVPAAGVRPRPPCRRNAASAFEIGDKVDAFHNDGWWAGEVSEVLDSGKKYAVRFLDYGGGGREEFEYEMDQIRVHMDWIDRRWVIPEKAPVKNLLGMKFAKEALVEVSSDDKGFSGAWYSAAIVESYGKDFLVEYLNLRTDDESEHLKEIVDFLHIRPVPPETAEVDGFQLLEEVDAFYNDGWWVGVISQVLEGPRYKVYFMSWREEMEFGHSDLRLHHEWIEGKWQQASKEYFNIFHLLLSD